MMEDRDRGSGIRLHKYYKLIAIFIWFAHPFSIIYYNSENLGFPVSIIV